MTTTRDLATGILGKSVDDFISRELRSGSSWSEIGNNLFLETGGRIDVSVATLKVWANSPKAPLTTE